MAGLPPAEKPRSAVRRWLLRLGCAVLALLGMVVAVAAGAGLWINSAAGLQFAVGKGLAAAGEGLLGSIEVEGSAGHLLSSFTLSGVRVLDPAGDEILHADALSVAWRPLALKQKVVRITSLEVSGLDAALATGPDGLNLLSILPPKDPDKQPGELPVAIVVDRLALDGAVTFAPGGAEQPYQLDDLVIEGALEMRGRRFSPTIERLTAVAGHPDMGPIELAVAAVLDEGVVTDVAVDLRRGEEHLTVTGDVGPTAEPQLDLTVAVERFDLDGLDVVAELPLTGVVGLDATVRGPLSALHTAGTLRLPKGEAGLDVLLRLGTEPLSYVATVDMERVDLSSFLTAAELPSSLSGRVTADGAGFGPESLTATVGVDLEDSWLRTYEVDWLHLEAAVEPDLRIRVHRLEAAAPLGQVDLHGNVAVRDERFSVAGTLEEIDVAGVGDLAGVAGLGGIAGSELTASGGWGGASGFFIDASGDLYGFGVHAPSTVVGHLTTSFDVGYGAGGVHGHARGDAYRLELGGTPADQATFDVDLLGTGLDGAATLRFNPELSIQTVANVDWSEQPLTIRADEILAETYGSSWCTAHPFTLEIGKGGALVFTGLELTGDDGTLTVEGTLAFSGPSDLVATGEGLQLSALLPLLPEETAPLAGDVALEVALTGMPEMPFIKLQLQAAGLGYDEFGPFALELGMVVAGGITTVVATAGGSDIEPLTLQGVLPLQISLEGAGWNRDGMLQLFTEIPLQDTGNLSEVLPQAEKLPPSRFGLTLTASGTGSAPDAKTVIKLRDVEVGGLPPLAVDVTGRIEDERFTIDGRARNVEAELVTVQMDGAFELGRLLDENLAGVEKSDRPLLGGLGLQLRLLGLPVETVRLYTDALDALHGKLVGELTVSGRTSDPVVVADLTLRGARLDEVALTGVTLSGHVEEKQLDLDLGFGTRKGGELALVATAPIDLSLVNKRTREERFGQDGLDGTLTGSDLPLDMVTAFLGGATDAEGMIQLDGTVRGSLLDPDPDLRLAIDDGAFCHGKLGVCFDRIDLQARTSRRKLVLQRFRMESQPAQDYRGAKEAAQKISEKQARRAAQGKKTAAPKAPKGPKMPERRGWIEASGSIALEGGLGDTELDVDAESFWISYTRQLKLQTDMKLLGRGTYPALKIRGDVVVGMLKIEMGDELRKNAWPMDPDPHLYVHRSTDALVEERKEKKRPAVVEQMDLQLDLKLERNCWIYLDVSAVPGLGRIRPDIQLEGDLGLSFKSGVFFSEGEVRTVRGNLTLLARQFRVDEGSVRFTGATPPDPILDVAATHRSRYGDIQVRVQGNASQPVLSFTSEEIDDEADILSVLLFGAPMDELRPGQSAEAGDELAVVTGMMAAQANQALSRLLGHSAVDMINLETNPAGPGSFGIEVGKSITDRIFLITRYRVGVDEDENQFEGQIEFQLTRGLYLEVRYGDAGNGALEIYLKKRLRAPRVKIKPDRKP